MAIPVAEPPLAAPVEVPPEASLAPIFRQVTGDATTDDIGRFLAGIPVRQGAILSRFQMMLDYQKFRRGMAEMWNLTLEGKWKPLISLKTLILKR